MGKALILSHIGEGKYSIRIYFDNKKIVSKITSLQNFIAELEIKIQELQPQKTEALIELQAAIFALNNAIQSNVSGQALIDLQKQAIEKRTYFDRLVASEKRLKLFKLSSEKEISHLQKTCPDTLDTTAWCVSRNTKLTGYTQTIEVDGCVERDVLTDQIRNDTGFWIPASQDQTTPYVPDNILQHALATSVHANWLNLALLPAVQRDSGKYRVATITSINRDDNNCNVTLDGRYTVENGSKNLMPSLPTHPIVDGGQQQNVSNVTIYYPPCNQKVFDVGDRVIVSLENGIKVIGFYSNPKRCRKVITSSPFNVRIFSLPPVISNPGAVATYSEESHYQLFYHIIDRPEPELDVLEPDGYSYTASATENNIGRVTTWSQTIGSTLLEYTYAFSSSLSSNETDSPPGSSSSYTRTQNLVVQLKANGISHGTVYDITFVDQYSFAFTRNGMSGTYTGSRTRTVNATARQLYFYDEEDIVKGSIVTTSTGSRQTTWENTNDTLPAHATSDTSTTTVTTYKTGDMSDVDVNEGTIVHNTFWDTSFGTRTRVENPPEETYVLGTLVMRNSSWSGVLEIKN